MVAVTVRLLGPVEVEVGGVPVALGGARQRAVLAALALDPQRPLATAELIRAVWGDDATDHEHRLQQQVSTLRKALDPGRAGGDPTPARVGSGYQLVGARVDVALADQAMADASAATAAGDWSGARAAWDRALAHWRGDALADVRTTPWLEAVATRLDERRLTAIEGRLDALLAVGATAEALDEVTPLVAAHPFRERLRARQMLALYRSGRQTDALAAFQEARRLLVEDLGIEPGTELRDLEAAILRQDPSLLTATGTWPGVGGMPGQVGGTGTVPGPASGPGPMSGDDVLAATFRAGPLDRGHVRRPDGQVIVLLEGETVIGRAPDAGVRLDDSRVSRRHARIECEGDRYRVVDLGSTNGTTVNGQPAVGQELADGDVIGIGSIDLPFHRGGPPPD